MGNKKIIQDAIFGGMCIALGAFAAAPLEKPWNGIVFSAGLVMIVLMQLQLFTGNILKARNGFTKDVLLKSWGLVYLGNFIGCFLTAKVIMWSGYYLQAVINIAYDKVDLTFTEAFWRAIFCNVLVCVAVYLSSRIKKVNIAKILVIIIPVTLFVISGYEHSVANMFYYTIGKTSYFNLIPVTLGNIIGGLIVIICTNSQYNAENKIELVKVQSGEAKEEAKV